MAGPTSHARESFVFDVDHQPVDAPPVLFHAVRVPCSCGRSLADCTYTFFPSSVFVHGVCAECGPRAAIFAPHLEKTQMEPMGERIARQMKRLLTDMAQAYGADSRDIINEFVAYLAEADHVQTAEGAHS